MIARLRETAAHHEALEELCGRYWKPVYAYTTAAWAKRFEDARDLTQAFFLWLLEGEALRRYSPERGGFRPYLKTLLRRFVGHQETALRRLKRGGGVAPISIDAAQVTATSREGTPEEIFDRTWVTEVVHQAVDRVRDRLQAEQRGQMFDVYAAYELDDAPQRPTHAAIAERFGLTKTQVNNHLHTVRERIRREIRAELRHLTFRVI